MQKKWIHRIQQVICWILLLQIINISIDPPDLKHPRFSSIHEKEDLSINKIESIYELIVEGVSDEDVPESDEDEIDTTSPPFVLYHASSLAGTMPAFHFPIEHYSHTQNNFPFVTIEPHAPPPELA